MRLKNLILLSIVALLCACQSQTVSFASCRPQKVDQTKVRARILQDFKSNNILFLQQGDLLQFVFPTTCSFNPYSAVLKPCGANAVRLIAAYIRTINVDSLEIKGYSVDNCLVDRNRALSAERAGVIGSLFWHEQLPVQLIFSKGEGGCSPVRNNDGPYALQNNRIEVTTRISRSGDEFS